MSKKSDYSNFSPAVLKVLAEVEDDVDIQPIKRSPVETILFAHELRERSDAITKKNEKIKEKVGGLATEILEMDKDLKDKGKTIHELKMKKAEKVDKLRVLHAQSKENESELNSLIRQMASLHSGSYRTGKNKGKDVQAQDEMNQLDTDVGTSSENSEQGASGVYFSDDHWSCSGQHPD